jgi:glycosyltransferase involved in cell wall biosynthesis
MPQVRVLHLIKTLRLGGAEANLLNLALATDPQCAEVHIGYSMGGELEDRFRSAGARLYQYAKGEHKLKSPVTVVIVWRVWNYIRRHKIDVVHTHNFSGHVWGVLAAKLAGVKVVEHVHDHRYTPREEFVRRKGTVTHFFFAPLFKRCSDAVLVLTEANRDFVVQQGYANADQVIELPNGLSVENGYHPSRSAEQIRAELGIDIGRPVVLTTARLDPAKNLELIFRIAREVEKEEPSVLFLISGDGPLLQEYREKCKQLDLENIVRFIGFYPQSIDLLSIADIFLPPTLLELHSIAILEAMRTGLPVVTSDGVGCNNRFLTSWENGVLLDPFSDQGWAESVIRLLKNEGLRKQLGERARKTCIERFDIRQIAGRIEDLYVELCGR